MAMIYVKVKPGRKASSGEKSSHDKFVPTTDNLYNPEVDP